MRTSDVAIAAFAAACGGHAEGPVVAVGGRTQFDVGGRVGDAAREIRAPTGIVEHLPAEMTVRVRAGTVVADLDAALAEHGQCVALPAWDSATVGGVLAVGRSGVRRLGWGPVRDTVLEATALLADGRLARAGGPTVKNVTGYDLCRLLVGSLGTLALLVEVVLRTRPVPPCERWFRAAPDADPEAVRAMLYRPTAVLWDGTTTWALVDGHPDDVAASAMAAGLVDSDPPALDGLRERWSIPPIDVASLPADGHGPFVAEVGVGVVHRAAAPPPRPVHPAVRALHDRLKSQFDPTGRLAPGREALPA